MLCPDRPDWPSQTFITLLLVPVFYSIFVLDLKWIKWETAGDKEQAAEAEPTT